MDSRRHSSFPTIPIFPVLFVALVLATGCSEAPSPTPHHAHIDTVHSELRPTDGDDPAGYEGAPTDSVISPEGYARIWWATEGSHRPPADDSDDDGVPDFVEYAAQTADDIAAFTDEEGWRLPLVVADGGDMVPMDQAPIDIYLVDFSAGDGHYRRDECHSESGQQVCAGHLRLENDFSPLYYPSRQHGLKVVLVHEFFHAVQAAYTADVPPWWSEGGATWFEEYFWPEQDDFERLTDYYFEEHDRSLNDRQRGAFDSYAYGASIFVYFLAIHIGADGVQAIYEEMAQGADTEAALADVLDDQFAPLDETFQLFAVWNLFTGSRAVDGQGYPDAQRFSPVSLVELDADQATNWNQVADPLAVHYARIDGDRAVRIGAEEIDDRLPLPVAVVAADRFADSGAFEKLLPGSDQSLVFEPEEFPLYLVAANGDPEQERAVQIQLRRVDDSEDDDTDDSEDDDVEIVDRDQSTTGGCVTTGLPHSGFPPAVLILGLIGLWNWRRRRFLSE